MPLVRRVISGAIASWLTLICNIIGQLVQVPVFLYYWDADTYGAWLTLQSMTILFQSLDKGHSRFLWNEFLRYTSRRRALIRRTLWSAALGTVLLSLLQVLALLALVMFFDTRLWLEGEHQWGQDLLQSFLVLLFLNTLVWILLGSLGGLLVMATLPFGHFARNAWIGLASAIINLIAPILSLVCGGGFWEAGLSLLGATSLGYLVSLLYLMSVAKSENIGCVRPSLRLMSRNLFRSAALTIQSFLDFFRQQGSRLILAPLAGTQAMTSFSTTRTGANVAVQGLSTLSSPLQPELMRFWDLRQQDNLTSCLATVWAFVLFCIIPCGLFAQVIAAPAFRTWTQGKVVFDPLLFSLLSSGVIVFGATQPAISITQGSNNLRAQLSIAAVCTIISVLLLFLLVPYMGISAAGISVLAAEWVGLGAYALTSARLLRETELAWPSRLFQTVVIASLIAMTGLVMASLIEKVSTVLLAVTFILNCFCCLHFWNNVPKIARQHIVVHIRRILRFFSFRKAN